MTKVGRLSAKGPVGYGVAKARFSAMLRRATQEHTPVVFERQRGGPEGVVVVDRDDLARALADEHRFRTEVFIEDGRHSIVIEDFGLHGTGPSFDAALADLVGSLREYADEYFTQLEFYRRTPNRAKHYLPLLRFRATPADRQIDLLLETDPRQVAPIS